MELVISLIRIACFKISLQVIFSSSKLFGTKQVSFKRYFFDTKQGQKFLEKLGYISLMNIKENDIVYKNGNLEIAINTEKQI